MATAAPSSVPVQKVVRTLNVSSTNELRDALVRAGNGDEILLAPGEYKGPWVIEGKVGLTVTGPGLGPGAQEGPTATLVTTHGGKPCLLVQGCEWCTVRDLALQGGQKALMVDASSDCVFDHLDVGQCKMEAVHFRNQSQRCTLQYSLVHDTGLGGDTAAGHGRTQADDGEGVYIGTALSNTPRDSAGQPNPDRSDGMRILYNRIWNTSVENIDIKEFTSRGVVAGNELDGGVARSRGVPAQIELKGSDYLIQTNNFTQPTGKHLVKVFPIRGAPKSGTNNTVSPDNQARG